MHDVIRLYEIYTLSEWKKAAEASASSRRREARAELEGFFLLAIREWKMLKLECFLFVLAISLAELLFGENIVELFY